MKVLVIGGSGMAGQTISLYLSSKKHIVDVIVRRKDFKLDNCSVIVSDVTNFSRLEEIIVNGNYDLIVNAVGILNKDAEKNKDQTVLVNSYLPHFLVKITKDMKTKIIHISTDCVFSGLKGNYKEDDLKDGNTFYDISKSLGEINDDKNATLRTSIIGPDSNVNGIGLFNWFMKQDRELNGFTKSIWTGITTITLAKAIEKAYEQNLIGLYNLVNNTPISKFSLVSIFNEVFKENKLIINEVDGNVQNKSLVDTRKDFDFVVPTYEEMIKEMRDWIIDYKKYYSHYGEVNE